jgi:uncharacterized protein (UPF0261 family)
MTRKTVLLMANLDTRGPEFLVYKDLVRELGFEPLLLDFSMEQVPPLGADITCAEVALAGGMDIDTVRARYPVERKASTDCMIRGARAIVGRLFAEGRIHGVMGAGGGTSTLVCTSAMRALPFGFPKVMATSIASHPRYVENCVGTRDITMLHTVVDVMGSNALLDRQLRSGIGAVCGMAGLYEHGVRYERGPVVAVTSFGMAERCVEPALALLRDRGFESVPFHAQGRGDRALDELVREGMIAGVIEVTPRGMAEEMLGGNGAGGPDRVLAAEVRRARLRRDRRTARAGAHVGRRVPGNRPGIGCAAECLARAVPGAAAAAGVVVAGPRGLRALRPGRRRGLRRRTGRVPRPARTHPHRRRQPVQRRVWRGVRRRLSGGLG